MQLAIGNLFYIFDQLYPIEKTYFTFCYLLLIVHCQLSSELLAATSQVSN